MAGLLDLFNDPRMGMAIGLLSGANPGGTFAGGAQAGLMNAQSMTQAAQQGQLMKAKLDEIEQEKKRREANRAAMQGLLGSAGNAPSDGMGPVMPGAGLLANPETAGIGGILQALPDDVQGQFLGNYALQAMKPAEDRTPADLAALQQAFGPEAGMQKWLAIKQPASTNISLSLDKPLSVSDARQVVMPDGSPAPIGWSPAQIAEAGGAVKPDLSPAQKAVDAEFAKQYAEFSAAGGSADVQKQISQLRDVRNTLTSKNSNLTGPIIGMTHDNLLNVFNPDAVDTTDRVQEVVQRNLRSILGPQFTEKEGTALIKRAYNPSLPEATNAKRMNSLITQMELAAKAKQAAATYYEQNGTLAGWKGKTYTINDFDPTKEIEQNGGWSARPK